MKPLTTGDKAAVRADSDYARLLPPGHDRSGIIACIGHDGDKAILLLSRPVLAGCAHSEACDDIRTIEAPISQFRKGH